MDPYTIREQFRAAFNGNTNFMTPTVIRYGKQGDFLYELSRGAGLFGKPLFGVTVLDLDGTHRHDLSESFSTIEEAESYIEVLKAG